MQQPGDDSDEDDDDDDDIEVNRLTRIRLDYYFLVSVLTIICNRCIQDDDDNEDEDMEMDEAGPSNSKQEPEIDDDGFQTVRYNKRR